MRWEARPGTFQPWGRRRLGVILVGALGDIAYKAQVNVPGSPSNGLLLLVRVQVELESLASDSHDRVRTQLDHMRASRDTFKVVAQAADALDAIGDGAGG